MNYNETYPRRSRYLKGTDLEGTPHTVIIEGVKFEQMRVPDNPKETVERPVLYFCDHSKGIVLTEDADDGEQTQTKFCRQLVEILGPEDSAWPGKTVELYPESGSAFGKPYTAVRVRKASVSQPVSQPPATPPTPPTPAILTPAQADFKTRLHKLFPDLTKPEAKTAVRTAIVTALGKDYENDDWRTFTPTQLGAVAMLLETSHGKKLVDDDGLDQMPF